MQTSGRRVRARERGRKVVNRSVGARDSTPHIQRQTGGVPRGGARVAFPTGGRSGSETISRRRSRAHAWPNSGGGRVVLWWARARSDEESVQPTRRSACRCVSVVRRGFNAAGDALQPCCTSRRVPARGPPSAIPSPALLDCANAAQSQPAAGHHDALRPPPHCLRPWPCCIPRMSVVVVPRKRGEASRCTRAHTAIIIIATRCDYRKTIDD